VSSRDASLLSDSELSLELDALEAKWKKFRSEPDDEGHAGSPGEWTYERMNELETEQQRREQIKSKTTMSSNDELNPTKKKRRPQPLNASAVRTEHSPEEFLLRVSWSRTPNHLVRRGEVMADIGMPPPSDPLTPAEMEEITFAAKMATIRILRKRKRK
jgi:hypothetical protein